MAVRSAGAWTSVHSLAVRDEPGADAGLRAEQEPHPLGRRGVEAAFVERLAERHVRGVGRDEERRRLARPADREVGPEGDAVLGKRRDELVAELPACPR